MLHTTTTIIMDMVGVGADLLLGLPLGPLSAGRLALRRTPTVR